MDKNLEQIIETEQTCALKGRLMWENLNIIREIIMNRGKGVLHNGFRSKENLWLYLQRWFMEGVGHIAVY